MDPILPAKRLFQELTARYGSPEACFDALDRLRVDPNADTIELLLPPDLLLPYD